MILSYADIETIVEQGYRQSFFVEEQNHWLQLKNARGRCVFHNGELCTIYKHRPLGCTLYPIVYDAEKKCAIIDQDCPQKQSFPMTQQKINQLHTLIAQLQKERAERRKKFIDCTDTEK